MIFLYQYSGNHFNSVLNKHFADSKCLTFVPKKVVNFHDLALFQPFFYPILFLLQLTLTNMKQILHLVSLKNITFKSSSNWFKIDIHQQFRPLTANNLAMFKVISTTIYT